MTPESVGGRTVADHLIRSLRILAVMTVLLYLGLIAGGIKVYLDAKNTNNVLCTFRQDLIVRVLASSNFLEDNPKGIPGVPTKVILEQIKNQQRTITALQGLDCQNVEGVK